MLPGATGWFQRCGSPEKQRHEGLWFGGALADRTLGAQLALPRPDLVLWCIWWVGRAGTRVKPRLMRTAFGMSCQTVARSPGEPSSVASAVSGSLVIGVGLLMLACAASCGPHTTRAARSHARPWRPSLAALFDDQNDLCVSWATSDEVWAVNERTLHDRRVEQADIIALGKVGDIVTSDTPGARNQSVFHFRVTHLLRGTRPDLPQGRSELLLPISTEQEARVTRALVGKTSVLFLRWLRKGPTPFHWHLACAGRGVVDRTRRLIPRDR